MGEKRNKSGIGSRLVFNDKQSFNFIAKEDEEFNQNTVTKIPQFSVEMRYFTVDMGPQSFQHLDYKESQGSFRIECLKGIEKSREIDDDSPFNTTSNDSFHSCHSTIDLQEVEPKATTKGDRNTTSSTSEADKPKSTPDEDLIQQLTLVNAIFLNNTVGECSHGKHSKKSHQESHAREPNRSKKGSNGGLYRFKSSPQQHFFDSELFACDIDGNSRVDCVNNIYGDNISTKPLFDGFTESNHQWSHKKCKPVINDSAPSDLSYKINKINCCQVPESKFSVRKRKHVISKPSITRRGVKKYKIKSSHTSPTCTTHRSPETFENGFKSIVEKRKQPINQAEGIHFFEPTCLNNSFVVIHLESEFSPEVIGHSQESYFAEDMRVNKSFMNKSVVSESKNVKKTTKNNLKKLFSKPQLCCKWNIRHSDCKYEEEIGDFKKEIGDVPSNNYAEHSDIDDSGKVILQTPKSSTKPEEVYFEYRLASGEDSYTGNKSQLSVIEEEEDVESVTSYRSADNIEDDYCLTDINGRPIHLFDSRGLPLTDGRGRPLKYAQGKIIMECDRNGIPVAENFLIFDMFGHEPHEEHFDPSRAPRTVVCNKLSTSDGRPLLLYDVEGRPLTSVSGTMLFDSSGRRLVQLTTNVESV